jgi:hypothetical protein
VCKCTHLTVLAINHIVGVKLAKLAFVLLRVIKLFYAVVSFQTAVAETAHVVVDSACNFRAHLACVCAKRPSPIFFEVVVVEAPLWIMSGHIV